MLQHLDHLVSQRLSRRVSLQGSLQDSRLVNLQDSRLVNRVLCRPCSPLFSLYHDRHRSLWGNRLMNLQTYPLLAQLDSLALRQVNHLSSQVRIRAVSLLVSPQHNRLVNP